MSWSDVAEREDGIASDAAVMSKPSAGNPVELGPEPYHDVAKRAVVHVEHSSPRDVVQVDLELVAFCRWLSTIADNMLCAAVTACMSPVRCKLKDSIGPLGYNRLPPLHP